MPNAAESQTGTDQQPLFSAGFLQAVIRATPECIKVVAPDGSLLQMNDAGLQMIGADAFSAVDGACTFELIAPEHRETWRENHRRICAGESLVWEFDIIGLNGQRRHMETHGVPFTMPDGQVAQLAVTRDVTGRWDAAERQRLLVNELNHRVKNSLMTAQSLARFSLKGQTSDGALRNYESRLHAMSRAHDVLTERAWTPAPISLVVDRALEPFRSEQIIVSGEGDPLLAPEVAVSLSLALHELATNACRHGSLTVPTGQVAISWLSTRTDIALVWVESGGPAVDRPEQDGFGLTMMKRLFAGAAPSAVTLDFAATGVRCRINLKVAAAIE